MGSDPFPVAGDGQKAPPDADITAELHDANDVHDNIVGGAEEHQAHFPAIQSHHQDASADSTDMRAAANPALPSNAAGESAATQSQCSSSLDDLRKWPISTASYEETLASQVALPPSTTSSLRPEADMEAGTLPEDAPLSSRADPRHETVPPPKKTSHWTAIRGLLEAQRRLNNMNISKKEGRKLMPKYISAPEIYHQNVTRLAKSHPNLKVVATSTVRHPSSPRVLYYDLIDSNEHISTKLREPWIHTSSLDFGDFHRTLRSVPDRCTQRIVFVEDLSPSLISLLGVTFEIPPQVFEEHLKHSGYNSTLDNDKDVGWHMRSSDQGYMSISWYRPVLSIIPATTNLRSKLILDERPPIKLHEIDPNGRRTRRAVNLRTTTNIYRPCLGLYPEPGAYHKGSKPEFPVGWEEKVTIWTREINACKFMVILMDPLPSLAEEGVTHHVTATNDEQTERILRAIHPTARLKQNTEATPKTTRNVPAQHSSQDRKVKEWADQASRFVTDRAQSQTSLAVASDQGVKGDEHDNSRAPSHISLTAAAPGIATKDYGVPESVQETQQTRIKSSASSLRRRTNVASEGTQEVKDSPGHKKILGTPHRNTSVVDPLSKDPRMSLEKPEDARSQLSAHYVRVTESGTFVPYHPVKVRLSSSSKAGNTFTSAHMQEHVEGLQVPTSTLEEFEHFLSLPNKGKATAHDPLQALFRVIHDDTVGLVDVVRVSLRLVREGTLDEDLMQKRVTFWRSLLHRLNFSLSDLEQRLRAFTDLAFELEPRFVDDGMQKEKPSQKLARVTRQTLRNCIELIERCSSSLLAEMQIVDSRRSIAEAESISKLTELAFVFVPLSFVASLFSMQVQELENAVPAYIFVLVSLAFVFVAYSLRLGIRSSRLVDYQNRVLNQMREESDLQYNQSIPTRIFLWWMSKEMVAKAWSFMKRAAIVVTPMALMGVLLAAVMSPIILLWLRDINKGFSAVITVLMLLLDVLLFHPIFTSGDSSGFNPRDIIREMQRERETNKRRARARAKYRADRDPEALSYEGDGEGYEWSHANTRSTARSSMSVRSRR